MPRPLLVCFSIRNANLIYVERTLCSERVVGSFSFHPRIQGNPILRTSCAAPAVSLKMPELNRVRHSSCGDTLRDPRDLEKFFNVFDVAAHQSENEL